MSHPLKPCIRLFVVCAGVGLSCDDAAVFPVDPGSGLSEFPQRFDLETNGHVSHTRFNEARVTLAGAIPVQTFLPIKAY